MSTTEAPARAHPRALTGLLPFVRPYRLQVGLAILINIYMNGKILLIF
mgnify:CR=1 FL=1